MEKEQFASRRRTPSMICTDNCNIFGGAEKELQGSIEKRNIINMPLNLPKRALSRDSNSPARQINWHLGEASW